MTPAEKAALMGLVEEWERRYRRDVNGNEYYAGSAHAWDACADELRALVAEMGERDGND